MRRTLTLTLLTVALVSTLAESARAIPAFARRWKISCTTCHEPFPRLKAFGAEFAGNGFVIPEDDQERDYVKSGDDQLKLNKDFPIAGRFDAYAVFDDDKDVDADLQSPWGLKLLSGGPLAKNVGYYFYFYMSERGEVAGVEDAIIHFDDVFSTGLDIAVGQFQTSDPLMKRELRLTFDDYQIYKTRVGGSNTNLTYDRGLMLGYGVERTGTDLIATITNGNGRGEADEHHQFDDNTFKNVGLRVAQSVGDAVSVGFYGYVGRDDPTDDMGGTVENDLTYWGPDLVLDLKKAVFTGQYLKRTDNDPIVGGPTDVETEGIVAELIYAPHADRSNHWFTLLYNRIDSDLNAHDLETFTFSATYTMARNVRLLAEYTRDLEHEANKVVIGTVTAF